MPPSPPLSALFLIYFDIKAGYTIGWKQSLPLIDIDGIVEYKSLPSGLHSVKEDLIYFVHEDHVGLSAFINAPATEEHRNARMIAVGVMASISHGGLEEIWKHAEKLRQMASDLSIDASATQILQDYWEQKKIQDSEILEHNTSLIDFSSDTGLKPLKNLEKSKSVSQVTLASPWTNTFSTYDPTWSMPRLLEVFGPLIFPIYRAALLRKRILIMTHAPVQESCKFVYDIFILSAIRSHSQGSSSSRLRPLFSIGVHDIPMLEKDLRESRAHTHPLSNDNSGKESKPYGWIACTTDSIIATKNRLYEVLVTMPPPNSTVSFEKQWPRLSSAQGTEIKATQRDLRRYKALKWGLEHYPSLNINPVRVNSAASPGVETPRMSSSNPSIFRNETPPEIPASGTIVEPVSWSALAHSSFNWWTLATEKHFDPCEEVKADLALLSDSPKIPRIPVIPGVDQVSNELPGIEGMAIISYFHRLTSQVLSTLENVILSTDAEDVRYENENISNSSDMPPINVSSSNVIEMGLDVWSVTDHQFIHSLCKKFYRRKARIEHTNLEVCGIKVC